MLHGTRKAEVLCIDCISHSSEDPMAQQHLCRNPELLERFAKSKVTGKVLPVFCEIMRSNGITGCGAAGKYWQPKPKGDVGGERHTDIQPASGEQGTSSKDREQGRS